MQGGLQTERAASTEALRSTKGQVKARRCGWKGPRSRWGRARLSEEEGPVAPYYKWASGGVAEEGPI